MITKEERDAARRFIHFSLPNGGMLFRVEVEYDALKQQTVFLIADDLTNNYVGNELTDANVVMATAAIGARRDIALLHLMQHICETPERHAEFLDTLKGKL